MPTRATGVFEVELTPSESGEPTAESSIGRLTIRKRFRGDLVGSSHGTMVTATTATEGSAGYVAVEMVDGALHGRKGSFVLQHSGTMTRGVQQLLITVVPDSGTGELEGLSGRMRIEIVDGRHDYDFEYSLDPSS